MRRALLAVALTVWWVGGLALAAEEGQDDKKPAVAKQVLDASKFDLGKALDMAQKKVPNGKPLSIRAEVQQGQPRFGVYFLDGDKIQEVEMNAATGEISKNTEREKFKGQTAAEVRKMLDKGKVSLKDAIDRSTAKVKTGKAFEAELELKNGKPTVEVELLDGNKITRVQIDPANARNLQVVESKK